MCDSCGGLLNQDGYCYDCDYDDEDIYFKNPPARQGEGVIWKRIN